MSALTEILQMGGGQLDDRIAMVIMLGLARERGCRKHGNLVGTAFV